jgi:hypothetical protein
MKLLYVVQLEAFTGDISRLLARPIHKKIDKINQQRDNQIKKINEKYGCTDGRTDGRRQERMDGWSEGRLRNGGIHGRTDGQRDG